MYDLYRGTAVSSCRISSPAPCASASSSGRGATTALRPPHPPRPARLHRPARNPNQSAGRQDRWVREFEPRAKPWIEPLMGWTACADVDQQVRLEFPTKESALRYALRHGLSLDVEATPQRAPVPALAHLSALHVRSSDERRKADEDQTVA
jgi:hypothetical protein